MKYFARYASPLGEITLTSNEIGITGLYFDGQRYADTALCGDLTENPNIPILQDGICWLDDYFAKRKPSPSRLQLNPKGSAFRRVVWDILLEIPYGETTTYGAVAKEAARRMGKAQMSARATGGAIGHNPISIIIPCHRVVGADGSLTGYGGGLEKKIFLLKHEGAEMSDSGNSKASFRSTNCLKDKKQTAI